MIPRNPFDEIMQTSGFLYLFGITCWKYNPVLAVLHKELGSLTNLLLTLRTCGKITALIELEEERK